MNTYLIHYVKGVKGPAYVKADSVNGFKPESDSYVFKTGSEVTTVIPKSRVVSVQRVEAGEDVD